MIQICSKLYLSLANWGTYAGATTDAPTDRNKAAKQRRQCSNKMTAVVLIIPWCTRSSTMASILVRIMMVLMQALMTLKHTPPEATATANPAYRAPVQILVTIRIRHPYMTINRSTTNLKSWSQRTCMNHSTWLRLHRSIWMVGSWMHSWDLELDNSDTNEKIATISW